MNGIPEDFYVEMAIKALEHRYPSDYIGYDERIGVTHIITGPSMSRDSDVLEESNYLTILADLREECGNEDVIEVHSGHWAVGWVDEIAVKVFKDGTLEDHDPLTIQYSDLTQAFISLVDWHEALTEYPVADDSHYSEMEFNKCVDNLFYSCNYYISRDDCETVYGYLFDMGYQAEDCWFSEREIREAVFYAYQAREIDVWDEEDLEDLALYALETAIKEKANV